MLPNTLSVHNRWRLLPSGTAKTQIAKRLKASANLINENYRVKELNLELPSRAAAAFAANGGRIGKRDDLFSFAFPRGLSAARKQIYDRFSCSLLQLCLTMRRFRREET